MKGGLGPDQSLLHHGGQFLFRGGCLAFGAALVEDFTDQMHALQQKRHQTTVHALGPLERVVLNGFLRVAVVGVVHSAHVFPWQEDVEEERWKQDTKNRKAR